MAGLAQKVNGQENVPCDEGQKYTIALKKKLSNHIKKKCFPENVTIKNNTADHILANSDQVQMFFNTFLGTSKCSPQ